jgi:hypothetical protein
MNTENVSDGRIEVELNISADVITQLSATIRFWKGQGHLCLDPPFPLPLALGSGKKHLYSRTRGPHQVTLALLLYLRRDHLVSGECQKWTSIDKPWPLERPSTVELELSLRQPFHINYSLLV